MEPGYGGTGVRGYGGTGVRGYGGTGRKGRKGYFKFRSGKGDYNLIYLV